MNTFITALLVITVLIIIAVLVIYNLYRQVTKQIYDQNGEYMGRADEPYDNKQVTSVPEKQITDL